MQSSERRKVCSKTDYCSGGEEHCNRQSGERFVPKQIIVVEEKSIAIVRAEKGLFQNRLLWWRRRALQSSERRKVCSKTDYCSGGEEHCNRQSGERFVPKQIIVVEEKSIAIVRAEKGLFQNRLL